MLRRLDIPEYRSSSPRPRPLAEEWTYRFLAAALVAFA